MLVLKEVSENAGNRPACFHAHGALGEDKKELHSIGKTQKLARFLLSVNAP
jgi:hypothetical protein